MDERPQVELLWWQGCPSWREAVELTRAEMRHAGLDPRALAVQEIRDERDAERHDFPGSPTVRVDGRDIQAPAAPPAGLTCRVYRLRDGRISALPDPADIADALRAATGREDG